MVHVFLLVVVPPFWSYFFYFFRLYITVPSFVPSLSLVSIMIFFASLSISVVVSASDVQDSLYVPFVALFRSLGPSSTSFCKRSLTPEPPPNLVGDLRFSRFDFYMSSLEFSLSLHALGLICFDSASKNQLFFHLVRKRISQL